MDDSTATTLGALVTNAIAQLFVGTTFGGISNRQMYYSFSWPPQVLEERAYLNPWTPDNVLGTSMVSTENMSNLVDIIPEFSAYFNPSSNQVSAVYKFILDSYILGQVSAPIAGKGLALRGSAARPALAPALPELTDLELASHGLRVVTEISVPDEDESRAFTVPTDAYLAQLAAERQAANEQAMQNAQRLANGSLLRPATNRLLAARPAYQPAAAVAEPDPSVINARSSLAGLFREAKTVFENTALNSLQSITQKFHASNIFPANFADPAAAAAWPALSYTSSLADNAPQKISISFRFCRVDIVRPWMMPYLFNLKGWGVAGLTSGGLSSGLMTANDGIFPLLPVSFIVGRDMTITDEKGKVYISTPGLQILARVCKVMPLLPA